ncbi:MAG: hypothetical protein AAGG48_31260, partial [Planctomycetota bacterium]
DSVRVGHAPHDDGNATIRGAIGDDALSTIETLDSSCTTAKRFNNHKNRVCQSLDECDPYE